ncbi:MAG: hypothetical protein MN733_14615 [Nitrososphaera sp.]|nr:hypothetical protein [Nitrososphaera sp.]
MAARSSKRPAPKCPVCKTLLADHRDYERAIDDLERKVLQKHSELSKRSVKQYEMAIADLKNRHAKEMQIIKANYKNELAQATRRLAAQAKKEKASYRKKLAVTKQNYRYQLQNTREIYDRQNLTFQKEQEYAFNGQLKEIIQNYGNLASGHQKELERLKKLQDGNNAMLRKKESEISKLKIELARSSSELQIKELVLQINERNVMIERLHSRIRELESRLGIQNPSPSQSKASKESQSPLNEDEQKQKLKEYMKAIIEITKNQQMAERKRREGVDSKNDKFNEDEQGSKVDKVLGWFF